MEQVVAKVNNQAHVSTGWLCPGDFIDALPDANYIRLLIFYPTVSDQAAVNTVVEGVFIFDVNLVVPAVIVGINQMFADEAA